MLPKLHLAIMSTSVECKQLEDRGLCLLFLNLESSECIYGISVKFHPEKHLHVVLYPLALTL